MQEARDRLGSHPRERDRCSVTRVLAGSFAPFAVSSNDPMAWRLPSAAEMAALDAEAIRAGVSPLELMERAGAAVASSVQASLGGSHGRVLVLCGPGNNGGDGLVVARLLAARGVAVSALLASSERYSGDCVEQIRRLGRADVSGTLPAALADVAGCLQAASPERERELFSSAALVVDALLGTGQRLPLTGSVAALVSQLRAEQDARPGLKVVAIDLPTGASADSGAVAELHVHADLTVAVEHVKRGCLQFPARAACGEIVAASIGISSSTHVAVTAVEGAARPRLPRRLVDGHKGDAGRVGIVGGSAAMPGAALLAALGALHAGAGLVTRTWRTAWGASASLAECMNDLLAGDSPGLGVSDLPAIASAAERADAVVLGPGLGAAPDTAALVEQLLRKLQAQGVPVVVDADALNAVAQGSVSLRDVRAIATPHPGEAARLLGTDTAAVQRDRFAAAQALSEKLGCVVVLKGAGTIVCGEGRCGVIARGSPYMATAGSGDVLSGVVAACASRSSSLFDAAAVAAYAHACAGERASSESGGPVLASEIARHTSSVMGALAG